ncbi:hypothetical protein [Tepidibacillus marianensis]|uniref:hypothetical protein n=1 Tax=Tepidibacillus marianensis TaxID=3131995 RepID=UPI0030CB2516
MDIKIIDKKMKESLMKHTEVSAEMKEDIWKNIDQELFFTEFVQQEKRVGTNKKTKKKGFVPFVLATAAATIILLGFQTQPGMALIDRIKQMFEPEKNQTQTYRRHSRGNRRYLTKGE